MIIAIQTLLFFRESFMAAIERFLRPYYDKFSKLLEHNCFESDSEQSDDNVCAEYDRERGVIFYPPVYVQRYAAVIDCLTDERWIEKIEKVVDFGCHDMSFIRYLTEVRGVTSILGVDIEGVPMQCFSHLLSATEYHPKREAPLQVTLLQGNAADPDYRLIGCDAVVAIEMIEHMLPHDLERLVHTVFGFIKPQIAIFTTPNRDFNVLFNSLEANGFRRLDHFFEWSRDQFNDWCSNIVKRYPDYTVSRKGIGPGPAGTSHLGCCSQMAMFVAKNYQKQENLNPNSLALVTSDFPRQDVGDLTDDWESFGVTEMNQICPAKHLNCTTLQVTKFSKIARDLVTNNEYETLMHAREVTDEVRRLKKMLNWNKTSVNQIHKDHTWCNINWGYNAPYWNQYYKLIKDYDYPFEQKTEECRILDTIFAEMNRLAEGLWKQYCPEKETIELPIPYIMTLLSHITKDEDKVRELLDWNGYEVKSDRVIYRIPAVETEHSQADDWQENESTSDVMKKYI